MKRGMVEENRNETRKSNILVGMLSDIKERKSYQRMKEEAKRGVDNCLVGRFTQEDFTNAILHKIQNRFI